jgi:predicted Zn-dependent peptidase
MITNKHLPVLLAGLLVLSFGGCRKSAAPAPKAPAAEPAKTSTAAQGGTDGDRAEELEAKLHPEAEWRRQMPHAGPPKPPVLPSFKTAQLKNGLTVIVPAEKSMLPLVSFELVTRGGASTDPPELAGLAALTYAMLNEGAGSRGALQFSDAVADLGAAFGANADRDRGSAVIGGLKRNADPMVALLADAVLRPKMSEKDFARRKEQMVAALERNRGSPQGLAFEALPALIYGPEHPYGHPPTGTVETAKKMTLAEVKKARARLIGPKVSALVAAGDISLEEAVALAEKHFGKWTAVTRPEPPIRTIEVTPRKEIIIVDKAPSPQTMIAIARPIFGKGHPDEAPMTVLNEIFGGAFTSRLNMNLREDKGYTYGASSQAAYRLGVGVFVAYSAVRQDVTAQSLQEFMNELEGLTKRPPTDEEVALAKAGIIRGLTGNFERTAASAVAADAIFIYALPLDYYTHLGEKYEGVDLDSVRRVANAYMKPELMKVLLVGDAQAIRPGVELNKLGPIVVREKP